MATASLAATPNPIEVGGGTTFETNVSGLDITPLSFNPYSPSQSNVTDTTIDLLYSGSGSSAGTVYYIDNTGVSGTFKITNNGDADADLRLYARNSSGAFENYAFGLGIDTGGDKVYCWTPNNVATNFSYSNPKGETFSVSVDIDYDGTCTIVITDSNDNPVGSVSETASKTGTKAGLLLASNGYEGSSTPSVQMSITEWSMCVSHTYKLQKETTPDVWEDVSTDNPYAITDAQLSDAGNYRSVINTGD